MPAEEVFTPPTHHLSTPGLTLYGDATHLTEGSDVMSHSDLSHRAVFDVLAADQSLARLLAAQARVPG